VAVCRIDSLRGGEQLHWIPRKDGRRFIGAGGGNRMPFRDDFSQSFLLPEARESAAVPPS
jgi:hypothetical protein